jgi:hypothetical protein
VYVSNEPNHDGSRRRVASRSSKAKRSKRSALRGVGRIMNRIATYRSRAGILYLATPGAPYTTSRLSTSA